MAQLRRDLVERKRLISGEDFLVLAELSKSLPGTPATNLLALLGQRIGGVRGGAVAAGAFVLPSTVLMGVCGAAYPLMRSAAHLSLFFDGMNAAMVGVVGAVTVDLARSALRSKGDVGLAAACGILLATRVVSEPVLAALAVATGATRAALCGGSKSQTVPKVEGEASPASERLHDIGALFGLTMAWTGSLATIAGLIRVFVPIGVMTFGGASP